MWSTFDTSQSLSGWLKELASQNIAAITVTLETFQLLSGWLKELAFLNISSIFLFMRASKLIDDAAAQRVDPDLVLDYICEPLPAPDQVM